MQAYITPEISPEEVKKIKKELGFSDNPVPYNPDFVAKAINHPVVEEIRIFRLKKGMIIDIGGKGYKVGTVRPRGKITLIPVR
jgi:hypothetical protein